MLTRRLTAPDRAPSAERISIGYIERRRLTFNKISQDGSGKCDAEETVNESDRVYGVLFEIDSNEKAALDRVEGVGKGYKEQWIAVVTESGEVRALTYIATKKKPGLKPYHWYKAFAVAGAEEHGLPAKYREFLMDFESMEDPNVDRRKENEALLAS